MIWLLDLLDSKEDSPFNGAGKLLGLYKGAVISAVESGFQMTLDSESRGAMHEALYSKLLNWCIKSLSAIDRDIESFISVLSNLLLREHTGDERSPERLNNIQWDRAISLGSWPPTYAGEKSCFQTRDSESDSDSEGEDEGSESDSDGESNGECNNINDSEDNLTNEEEGREVWGLTDVVSDHVYNKPDSQTNKYWVDTYERSARIYAPDDDLTTSDHKNALANTMKTIKELKETKNNPFSVVRFMNLNENTLMFSDGVIKEKYGCMKDLIQTMGYQKLHQFFYVGVYCEF